MSDATYPSGSETEHASLARLVGAFVDGELPPALHRRVEAHLECCEECRGDARLQIAVRTRLGSLSTRPASADFRERVVAGLNAAASAEAEPMQSEPVVSGRSVRRIAVTGGAAGWLVAAALAGLLLGRSTTPPAGAGMTMATVPALPVAVDSTPAPMADDAISDFRRVTGSNLPAGISLDSLRSALAFSVPALTAPHMRLIAVWRTEIDGTPAGALAYICHNRLVLQYVVSDQAFFRLARIRQAVAAGGLYAAGRAGVHTVGYPAPGSASFLVGEFSAAELAAMRL